MGPRPHHSAGSMTQSRGFHSTDLIYSPAPALRKVTAGLSFLLAHVFFLRLLLRKDPSHPTPPSWIPTHSACRLSCCTPCLLFLETHILVKLKCIVHLLGTEFIESTVSGRQDFPFRSDFEANLTNSHILGLGFTGSLCFSLSEDIPR